MLSRQPRDYLTPAPGVESGGMVEKYRRIVARPFRQRDLQAVYAHPRLNWNTIHPSQCNGVIQSSSVLKSIVPTRILGVIPARFASSRFPGKALAPIAGKPMLQHVYERASQARYLTKVIIATDDDRI